MQFGVESVRKYYKPPYTYWLKSKCKIINCKNFSIQTYKYCY